MPTRETEQLAGAGRESIEVEFQFDLDELLIDEWMGASNVGKLSLTIGDDFIVDDDGTMMGRWRALQAVSRRLKAHYEDNGIVAKVTTFPNPSIENKRTKETAASKRETEKVYVYTLPSK
jgi:hypothetical protein